MENNEHIYTNALINESSLYLRQHAHNPVDWFPWGDEAFEKAKAENKMLLISIGYSACHWCHVMEHESFEDEEIAQAMNENYVCVKVDREERPDVDKIYVDAVQLITGNAGWPLNCFVLPDGRPVFGGTYFKPKQWLQIVNNLANTYKNTLEKIEKAAMDLQMGIQSLEMIQKKPVNGVFDEKIIEKGFEKWAKNFDNKNGGTKGAPKFALPVNLEFLIDYHQFSKSKDAIKHLELSLNKIAQGGIYDHIGGGFARYSVDSEWHVPHFEKMLYDNAQMLSLYSKAYILTKKALYRKVVIETAEFIQREFLSEEGGFYSSIDADSEGVEGKFYVWDFEEVKSTLGDDAELFCEYYDIKPEGNWEGKNILRIVKSQDDLVRKYVLTEAEFNRKIENCKKKLFELREKRVKPATDYKVLTSWNALTTKAFVDAYVATGKDVYYQVAMNNAIFIEEKMLQPGFTLNRTYNNGYSKIEGFLDDYAFTIEAFIAMYKISLNERWLQYANDLAKSTIKEFYNEDSGMFYYAPNTDTKLLSRKYEIIDNVIPAASSTMAHCLTYLGHVWFNDEYLQIAQQLLSTMEPKIGSHLNYFAKWASLVFMKTKSFFEVVVIGSNARDILMEFGQYLLPNIIVVGALIESDIPILKYRYKDSETLIYVCHERTCKQPVTTISEALAIINQEVNL